MDFLARTQAHNAFVTPPATITPLTTITGGASSAGMTGSVTLSSSNKPRLLIFAMGISNVTLTIAAARWGNYPLTVVNYMPAGDNTAVAIAYGIIPAGVSGTDTAYVYFSGTNGSGSGAVASVFVCENITSPIPVGTVTSDIPTAPPIAFNIDSKPNGVVVGAYATANNTSTTTWTNMTEVYDASVTNRAFSTAYGTTDSTTFATSFNGSDANSNRCVMYMTFR